jgi:chaperone modulatory protein CbpM
MQEKIIKGVILDEQVELTLHDMCRVCSQRTEWVVELVNEGVLDPVGNDQEQWRFSGPNLQRAHAAMRLERDLGLNLAGIALALDLIEEVGVLRQRLDRLETEE